MIPDLGRYAGPVLWSYAVGVVIILALVVLTWWQSARVKRALAVVEARAGARAGARSGAPDV